MLDEMCLGFIISVFFVCLITLFERHTKMNFFISEALTLNDFSCFHEDAEKAFTLWKILYETGSLLPAERKRFNALQMKHLNDIVL